MISGGAEGNLNKPILCLFLTWRELGPNHL